MFDIDPIQLDREISSRSFYEFVKMSWHVVEPIVPFSDNHHIEQICKHLEACYRGDLTRLVINIPPAHSKSLSTGVLFPAWVWTQNPSKKFFYTSYNLESAKETHVKFRTLVQSDWYRSRWGNIWEPKAEAWGNTKLMNSKMGVRYCASMTGTITGRHVDFFFVDDPIKPVDTNGSENETKAKLNQMRKVFTETIPDRLVNREKSCIIVIMQRLHEEDVAGVALASGEFEHLCFPLQYKEGHYTYNKLGRYDIREKEGEILWPTRYTLERIESLQKQTTPLAFACQYQQSPIPAEGNVFKHSWTKFYDDLPEKGYWIQSWDTSAAESKSSDFTVGQVWMRSESNYYLVDQVRARMEVPEIEKAIVKVSAKWPKAIAKHIEKASTGPEVIRNLRKLGISGIIEEKQPKSSKFQRANAVTPLWAAGNVYLPNPAKHQWVNEFINEICTFDNGKYDDQVDAMSQALNILHKRSIGAMISTLKNMVGHYGR